jgi:Uma2 family endonuclease
MQGYFMVSNKRMTAAEFSQLPETNQPTELIGGMLIVSPCPTPIHQRLAGRFVIRINQLLPNGEIFFAPIGVYFDNKNILEPDIVWVSDNDKCVIGDKYLEGAPELIIEIFSPGTQRYDRREKYELYERFGVREYWMADPVGQFVEVCVWANGTYKRQGVYGPDESFESPVLRGKLIELKGIFKE